VNARQQSTGLLLVNNRAEDIAEAAPMCGKKRHEQRRLAHRDGSALVQGICADDWKLHERRRFCSPNLI